MLLAGTFVTDARRFRKVKTAERAHSLGTSTIQQRAPQLGDCRVLKGLERRHVGRVSCLPQKLAAPRRPCARRWRRIGEACQQCCDDCSGIECRSLWGLALNSFGEENKRGRRLKRVHMRGLRCLLLAVWDHQQKTKLLIITRMESTNHLRSMPRNELPSVQYIESRCDDLRLRSIHLDSLLRQHAAHVETRTMLLLLLMKGFG